LEWLFHDEIPDTEIAPSKDEAPYSTTTFQRSPRTCTDGLFHPLTGIAWGFDEEAYSPNTDALPKQFIQSDATHDNLATTCS